MVLQYIINVPLLIGSLAILLIFKSDITLYLTFAVMAALSVRVLITDHSPAARGTLFLIQATIFGIGIWYVFYPERFTEMLMLFGIR